jgi:four helix bundle protein
MELEILAEKFPSSERFKLTDQISRSSRSVCSNLGESFGKRRYPKHFIAKITDALGESYETQVWLDFALAKKYIDLSTYQRLIEACEEVSKLLSWMEHNPGHFANRLRK